MVNEERILNFLRRFESIPRQKSELSLWTIETAKILSGLALEKKLDPMDLSIILVGLIVAKQTGITPEIAHLKMIRVFCQTNGLSNELIHSLLVPELHLKEIESHSKFTDEVFGNISQEFTQIVFSSLESCGYAVIESAVPDSLMSDFLKELSFDHSWSFYGRDGFAGVGPLPQRCSEHIAATLPANILRELPSVKALLASPLLNLLASYAMKAQVTDVVPQVQYTFPDPACVEASSELAQLFHYDFDSTRFAKIFIYCNDVSEDNGPHVFIPGTHAVGKKSGLLLSRGYSRVSDSDMAKHQMQAPVVVTGKCGTVIVGNTKCWHKGMPVSSSFRLMLTLVYYSSSNISRKFEQG